VVVDDVRAAGDRLVVVDAVWDQPDEHAARVMLSTNSPMTSRIVRIVRSA
jgi:hypothetical protein